MEDPSTWLKSGIGGNVAIDPSQGVSFFINNLIPFLISGALTLAMLLSLFFVIIGGIKWTMSGGEKQAVASAKNTVTYALIGLALALSVFIVANIIQHVFYVNLGVGRVCPPGTPGGQC